MRDTSSINLDAESWMARGACVGHALGAAWDGVPANQSPCHPAVKARVAAAIAVCQTCPVMVECGDWAEREPFHAAGIIAGGQLREARVPEPVRCGSLPGYWLHYKQHETPCAPCRDARNRHRRQQTADRFLTSVSGEATG